MGYQRMWHQMVVLRCVTLKVPVGRSPSCPVSRDHTIDHFVLYTCNLRIWLKMSFGGSSGNAKVDQKLQEELIAQEQLFKFNSQVAAFTDMCWDKCVEKPGSKLDGKTETCIVNCVERFLDTQMLITKRFAERFKWDMKLFTAGDSRHCKNWRSRVSENVIWLVTQYCTCVNTDILRWVASLCCATWGYFLLFSWSYLILYRWKDVGFCSTTMQLARTILDSRDNDVIAIPWADISKKFLTTVVSFAWSHPTWQSVFCDNLSGLVANHNKLQMCIRNDCNDNFLNKFITWHFKMWSYLKYSAGIKLPYY